MKIVLDTNVLIAAFISPKGVCSDVFEMCIRNHSLISSEFILSELKEKLELKFGFEKSVIEEISSLLLLKSELIRIKGNEIEVCRDSSDNNVIETAYNGKADIIITGDKDLLVLEQYKNISIVTPREFYNYEKGSS